METFRWIQDFLKDKQTHSCLKDLIPNNFDRYFLLPWTVGIIDNFPFSDYPDNKDTIENLNKQHAIEKDFGIFLQRDTEAKYREATLKEIAERFNVEYCADTDYLIKTTPGILPHLGATKRKLLELIEILRIEKELNLFIEDNFRFQVGYDDWNFQEVNIIHDASDYFTFREQTGWDSTSFLFAKDLKWCLCTVEDFEHFIFCCNNSTHAIIQEMKSLEAFEIDYEFVLHRVRA